MMITVEQIHQLEKGVKQAVEVINSLKEENGLLKNKLSGYETRIEELEVLINSFKEHQTSIEDGIVNALQQLDVLEDLLSPDKADDSGNSTEAQKTVDDTEDKTAEPDQEKSPENELDIF